VTPNLDRLASQGVRYNAAFAPIGVCAPSRSSLITGMFAPSLGTQHMRCQGRLPESVQCFPQYLRRAGYYCTNNVKTDYNFPHDKATWDESSNRAHWRGRGKDQPFFAVFNLTASHEGQIRLAEPAYRRRTADFSPRERHDPARAPIPPYHPRHSRGAAGLGTLCRYGHVNGQAGRRLAPRARGRRPGRRYDRLLLLGPRRGDAAQQALALRVEHAGPLIVRFPEELAAPAPGRPGTATDRLVSFVDFAPTVLSLAGVAVPGHMQGAPFLGAQAGAPRRYVYGFRDRMDERYDLIRSVRDRRYPVHSQLHAPAPLVPRPIYQLHV